MLINTRLHRQGPHALQGEKWLGKSPISCCVCIGSWLHTCTGDMELAEKGVTLPMRVIITWSEGHRNERLELGIFLFSERERKRDLDA